MASLEAELSEVKLQTHIVEQENLLLKDELEKLKQVSLGFPRGVKNDMALDVFPATKCPVHCG